MSGQHIEEMRRRAVEAVKSDEETIRSASAKYCISLTNIGNKMAGGVALLRTPGSPTVLIVEEKTVIRDLVVYGSMHCPGNTSQQICNNARKLCHDGRSVPSDPAKGTWPGLVCVPILTLCSSRIHQTYCVPANDRTLLDVSREGILRQHSTSGDTIWNTDEVGNLVFSLIAVPSFICLGHSIRC